MSLHYLLDGYNAIYALEEMPTGPWEKKREYLLALLLKDRPQGKNRLTIVFDSREGSGDRSRRADLEIVYTAGETADDWISQHVRQAQNPRVCVVVTNDQGLRRLVRGTGARSISVEEFLGMKGKREPKPEKNDDGPRDADEITDEFKKKWT